MPNTVWTSKPPLLLETALNFEKAIRAVDICVAATILDPMKREGIAGVAAKSVSTVVVLCKGAESVVGHRSGWKYWQRGPVTLAPTTEGCWVLYR